MLPYTTGAIISVVVAVALDRWGTRERLVRRPNFWIAYAIIVAFQLLMNGALTGLPIVTYDPSVHLGPRLVNAPIEDIAFGFALVLSVLTVWSRRGPSPQTTRGERRGDR